MTKITTIPPDLMHQFITLLSIFLTPITMSTAALVIFYFYGPVRQALASKDRTATDWMIIGIVIGFNGAFFDNLYWAIAWSADYSHPASDFRAYMFSHGVYSNTIFRQTAGIIAALCHIIGARYTDKILIKRVIYGSFCVGALWVLLLTW